MKTQISVNPLKIILKIVAPQKNNQLLDSFISFLFLLNYEDGKRGNIFLCKTPQDLFQASARLVNCHPLIQRSSANSTFCRLTGFG
jgi:hypothetical protein